MYAREVEEEGVVQPQKVIGLLSSFRSKARALDGVEFLTAVFVSLGRALQPHKAVFETSYASSSQRRRRPNFGLARLLAASTGLSR